MPSAEDSNIYYDTSKQQLLGLITQLENLMANDGDSQKALRSVSDLYQKIDEVRIELSAIRHIVNNMEQPMHGFDIFKAFNLSQGGQGGQAGPSSVAPVLSGTFNLPDMAEGDSFNADVSSLVSGGDAATSWAFTGTPPTNASIDSAGLITGVSVAQILAADSFGIIAINSGGISNVLTDSNGITISAAPVAGIPDAPINLTLAEGVF